MPTSGAGKVKKLLAITALVLVGMLSLYPFFDRSARSEKIELLVDLHGYTPSTSRIPTADSPEVFNATHYIAEAFMKENPDVEIVWAHTKPVGGMNAEVAQWFTTQIAGGTVPAVAFSWGTAYQDRNWYLPLDTYLDSSWPYEGGFATWRDVFRDYLWSSSALVNARGETVAIPVTLFPGAATGYFYNRNAFRAAGIAQVPLTWQQLLNTAQALEGSGFVGIAPWLYFDTTTTFDAWVYQAVISPSFAGAIMDQLDTDRDGTVSQIEQLQACLEGHFSSRHALTREMYGMLKRYYTQTLQSGWASIDYYTMWLNGDVGIREEGLWAIPVEDSNVVRDFDYGVFVAPLVSTDSSSLVKEVRFSVGPWQPAPDLSLNIMRAAVEGKPEVLDAAVRFLKFLTRPDNVSVICIENGGVLGAAKGTGHSNLIDSFIRQKFPIVPKASWPAGFTDEHGDQMNRRFEEWVNGQIDDNAFFTAIDRIQHEGALAFMRNMKLDLGDLEAIEGQP